MLIRMTRPAAMALALSLGLSLAACGGSNINRSLYSTKQPVVERANFALDVRAGADGLSIPEQRRLAAWFETMDLRYGDRVALDDPAASPATREAVAALAGRHGLLLSETAPVTPGFVEPGTARIVLTRSRAHVPGCPDWTGRFAANYGNATTEGFGCAVNGNFAAMVADPEHLLEGAQPGTQTYTSGSSTAISTYRERVGLGAAAAATGGN